MKKGRHRRYEEARALKRGPDLDVEALFDDLGGERPFAFEDAGPSLEDDDDELVDRWADDGDEADDEGDGPR